MKILFCTSFFEQTHNGAGQFANTVFRINELFPEHEVRILSEDITQTSSQLYPIKIAYPRILQGFVMLLRSFSYYRAAMQIQKTYDFDVLFFNNAFTGLWSAIWMPKKVKVIGFIHDDNYLSYSLSNFSWKKKWLVRYFYRQIENLSVKFLDATFTNTLYLQKYILEQYKAKPTKLYQSYVPVDIQNIVFSPDRSIDLKKSIKILFVKNDYIRGGLEDLITALGLLSYQFQLSILGPFPSAKKNIQALTNKHSNIRLDFRGNCSQEEVFAAMKSHHILSIPARKEGQGVANIEGLAYGIPVISTNVGGIPEIMDQGNNAWLVESNSPQQLAGAIEDCLKNPTKRLQKTKQGRAFISLHFDQKNSLEKLLQYLQTIRAFK